MSDIDALEKTLASQQWVGGAMPSNADTEAYTAALTKDVDASTHPNVFAWFTLCYKFSDAVRNSWAAAAAGGKAKGGKKGGKAAPKKDDDEMDLFGDDDDEESAAAAKEAAAKAKAKKNKVKPPEMSLIIFEVKPLDDTTNLDDLAKRIFALKQEGLIWKHGDYKKIPVAYGIFKLIVGFSCEDSKVSVDDVQEQVEGLDDMVQSVEIASFTKI